MKHIILSFTFLCAFFLTSYAQQESLKAGYYDMATDVSELYSWNKYPTYDTYLKFMDSCKNNFPSICRLDTIGYSTQNRLLLALRISSNLNENKKPKFFYSSTIHGNETTGIILLMRMADSVLNNYASCSVRDIDLYICPIANLDGLYRNNNNTINNATRYNANNVDLNRNFPDPVMGENNSYEVETQAFMNYALREKFDMGANLHTGEEVFNYPYDCWTSAEKTHADRNWFVSMAEDFMSELDNAPQSYFRTYSSSGYVDGGDWYKVYGGRQDWHTYFAHCREVTLEVSSQYAPPSSSLPTYWNYLHNSLFVMTDYCQKGFEGVVKDATTTEPLADVQIFIENHDRDNSEVYTNDEGYFFRPIQSGEYSVIISKQDYESQTMNVQCFNNMLSLGEIYLQRTQSLYTIYPLPASDVLNLDLKGKGEYLIADMMGRVLKRGIMDVGHSNIDLSDLRNGTYIFTIKINNRQYNKQLSVVK